MSMKHHKKNRSVELKHGIGLVLCGGGTKGAYEIGAWRALKEKGVFDKITGFSGASIGAFNSAFMADGDLEKAEKVWLDFNVFDFVNLNQEKISKKILKGAGRTKSENIRDNFAIRRAGRIAFEKIVRVSSNKGDKALRKFKKYLNIMLDNKDLTVKKKEFEHMFNKRHSKTPDILSYNKRPFRNFWIWFIFNAVGSGYATSDRLRSILENNVVLDIDKLASKDYFSVVCDWRQDKNVSGRPVYVNWKGNSRSDILDLIFVSGAYPILYQEGVFKGKKYVDGGYADNEPIKPLYDIGYRKIIIVYLDRIRGFELKQRISMQEHWFPGCKFLRIIPNPDFNDSFSASLVLTREMTEKRIRMGYKDALKALEKADPEF